MTRSTPDRRPTLTVKGAQFTAEWRALVNKAAKRSNRTQAEFVAETLAAAARRILAGEAAEGGTPGDTPAHNPPATVQQIEDLQAVLKAVREEGDQKAEAVAQQLAALAEQVATLTAPRRGVLGRILGR